MKLIILIKLLFLKSFQHFYVWNNRLLLRLEVADSLQIVM